MKIEFTKEVVFKDTHGTVLKTYAIGEQVAYTTKSNHYWITPMGGIYFDEAKEVADEDHKPSQEVHAQGELLWKNRA